MFQKKIDKIFSNMPNAFVIATAILIETLISRTRTMVTH